MSFSAEASSRLKKMGDPPKEEKKSYPSRLASILRADRRHRGQTLKQRESEELIPFCLSIPSLLTPTCHSGLLFSLKNRRVGTEPVGRHRRVLGVKLAYSGGHSMISKFDQSQPLPPPHPCKGGAWLANRLPEG